MNRIEFSTPMEMVHRLEGLDEDERRDLIYRMALDLSEARERLQQRRVEGWCPMGCGKTLTLARRGVLECTSPDCADPIAATSLLAERETEHIVRLYAEADFTAKHPIKERVADRLFECTIGAAMLTKMARDLEPGVYRVARSPIGPGGWSYERVEA